MIAGIVKASTLAKHGRWDVGYYLGTEEAMTFEKAIDRDKTRLQNAAARLAATEKRLEAEKAKLQDMIDKCEVIPITPLPILGMPTANQGSADASPQTPSAPQAPPPEPPPTLSRTAGLPLRRRLRRRVRRLRGGG